MKRFISIWIIILVFFLTGIPVNAQDWQLQTSNITDDLWDVYFTSENVGVAVGSNAAILRTTNGGQYWQVQGSPTVARLNGVFFTDDSTGTAVGFLGAILRTINGGQNWDLQSANTSGVLSDVFFFDINNGMITQGGVVHHTVDGGQNWTHDTVTTDKGLGKIAFADANTGIILAGGDRNNSFLFRTTDGGQNWTEIIIPIGYGFSGVSFGSSTIGTAVGSGGKIYRTTDGGQNWTSQNSGTTESLADVFCTDPDTCTAVGVNGLILRTTDGGLSWISEPNPLVGIASLHAISFINADNGWAVGDSGNIIYRFVPDTIPSITEQKLTNAGEANDHFGISVSISEDYPGNDYTVIGVSGDDTSKGSAYIYEMVAGFAALEDIITASDGESGDRFGCAVAVDSQTAVIGMSGDDDNGADAGAAYIFHNYFGWLEDTKLTASDGTASDSFGSTVAISGGYAIVGAPGDENSTGAAYIFKRDNINPSLWVEEEKLTASDGSSGDYFGYSVDLDNGNAIIGARAADIGGNIDQGSAYIFMFDGIDWIEQPKLTSSDGQSGDLFGVSVSIAGNYAIAGAENNTAAANSSGAAYVYELSGGNWIEQVKLSSSDGAAFDRFGSSVSISGDYALVSAPADDDNAVESGSAYIFARDISGNWSEDTKLTASDGATNDEFGFSVSLAGEVAVCGAPFDDDNSPESGSAYIYQGFIISSIQDEIPAIPVNFTLKQNYPNPFNPSTTIQYDLPVSTEVSLIVYNVLGQEVANLVQGYHKAGSYNVVFDAGYLASGIYIYLLKSEYYIKSNKMVLVK